MTINQLFHNFAKYLTIINTISRPFLSFSPI